MLSQGQPTACDSILRLMTIEPPVYIAEWMAQITSLYVYKVIRQASPGVETRDLIAKLGLDPDDPVDPSHLISSQDYYDFFAALVDRDPDGLALPWRVGASMRIDDYGAFGLAWKSAPSLRGSFFRSERYGRVLGSAESYALEQTADGLFFCLEKAGDGRPGMLLSNEASLSAVDVICREATTADFKPLTIYLKHSPRGPVSAYEDHFGCLVHFETGRDALQVSAEQIDAPNKLGDETIATFFDRHLEKELGLLIRDEGLEQRVRRAIAEQLSEGVPTLTDIGSQLGIGTRTLQRRLSEQGHSFQSVVDSARMDMARRLLRETGYSIAEIAFLTGFSEQSGFTRAFKRWAGQTPRSYRLEVERG